MRLEAGLGQLALVGIRTLSSGELIVKRIRSITEVQQLQHTQAVEQITNTLTGVKQLNAVQSASHAQQDAKEGAVHIYALGEI